MMLMKSSTLKREAGLVCLFVCATLRSLEAFSLLRQMYIAAQATGGHFLVPLKAKQILKW